MKGIFSITWADKKNKPAVSFEVIEVSEVAGAYLPIKGSKVENHLVEISEEIDSASDKVAALNVIKNYLTDQGIEAMNYSEKLTIK